MAIQSFRCHDNFFHLCLDKGDIIDYPWNRHGFESYESNIHMLHQKYRCKNWNDIDKAINTIMETDVGAEIELDLKSENIDSIENEQK